MSGAAVEIVSIADPEERQRIVAAVLAVLPRWFGRPESTARHIRDAATFTLYAARSNAGEVAGFVTLRQTTPAAVEIDAMGVVPERHRSGIGVALVERAVHHARTAGAGLLTVKTLGPSHPNPDYAKTRAFYAATGFLPVEEFPTLWGDIPCLLMARPLHVGRAAAGYRE